MLRKRKITKAATTAGKGQVKELAKKVSEAAKLLKKLKAEHKKAVKTAKKEAAAAKKAAAKKATTKKATAKKATAKKATAKKATAKRGRKPAAMPMV